MYYEQDLTVLSSDLQTRAGDILRVDARREDELIGVDYLESFWPKRVFDIACCTAAGTTVVPLLITAMILPNIVELRHNPFYRLTLIIPNADLTTDSPAKSIPRTKIRTMYPEADRMERKIAQTHGIDGQKRIGDERVTKIGRILRLRSLDEITQVYDVIFGRASLVGPRGFSLSQWLYEIFPNSQLEYLYRQFIDLMSVNNIRHGITGLSQILGRSNLALHEKLALDLMYLEHASFLSDLLILKYTYGVVKSQEGAY